MLRTSLQRRGVTVVLATAAGVALWAAGVRATETDMNRLPVTSPYLCLACHTEASPSGINPPLNPFGADYLDNGRGWDQDLAALDSDGDGCTNGFEIGDSDGNGQADGNVTEQAGNPGVPDDCGSGHIVDEQTWGALKAMFDGR